MLLIPYLEGTVLGLCKGASTLAPRLLEQRGAVSERRANFARQMGACIWVVSLVGVGEIGAEPCEGLAWTESIL